MKLLTLALVATLLGSIAVVAQAAPVTREVHFRGAGGTPLAGTLVFPAEPTAAVPAVLLIQGSGPTDRDGNQLPSFRTDLLRQIADRLAASGIASLRYDKRGLGGNSGALPLDVDGLAHFAAWENFVGDAQAAFRILAAEPGVDRGRVGVIGHSEGGLIGLDLGARHTVAAKVLVLLATPGRPMGAVITDQLTALLARQKASPVARRFFLTADARIRSAIAATGEVPRDVPPGLQALYPAYLGPFYRAELALDPIALAAAFPNPILIVNGGADVQVSAERDAGAFARSFAGRHDGSEVMIAPGVSHNLKDAPTGEPGIAGPLDPSVAEKLAAWLAAHL